MGVGGDSTREANRWKPLLGPASFPLGGVVAGLRAQGYRLRVEADDEIVTDTVHKALMVTLANGRHFGAGEGRTLHTERATRRPDLPRPTVPDR